VVVCKPRAKITRMAYLLPILSIIPIPLVDRGAVLW
jgi:hypothetical protein